LAAWWPDSRVGFASKAFPEHSGAAVDGIRGLRFDPRALHLTGILAVSHKPLAWGQGLLRLVS
jgi:hypothetical protein